jgi:hypothetical protein
MYNPQEQGGPVIPQALGSVFPLSVVYVELLHNTSDRTAERTLSITSRRSFSPFRVGARLSKVADDCYGKLLLALASTVIPNFSLLETTFLFASRHVRVSKLSLLFD